MTGPRIEVAGVPLAVRAATPSDEAGCVACYNAVFPVEDPRVPPIDAALWRWKYAPPGAPGPEIVVADHAADGIVGAYPCQPFRAAHDGVPIRVAQITDLMVRRDIRRAGPRPGLFATLGRLFYERFAGGPGGHRFHYGWPVPAWRMGQRYLRYENVRDWNFLAREIPVDTSLLRALPAGLEVARVERLGADADALFERLRHGYRLTLWKDAAYLNWRYAEHPRHRYELLECRDRQGALRAVGVYTVGDFRRPRTAFVTDLLVDPADADALAAVIGACERRARRDETGAIAGVWSPIDPRFRELQRLGYAVWDSGYFLVAATFGLDAMLIRERFAFTMGDSDLV